MTVEISKKNTIPELHWKRIYYKSKIEFHSEELCKYNFLFLETRR
jgi:hypothetical protein